MSRPTNRITPKLNAAEMKTFQVAAPLSSHWRDATCEEVQCDKGEHGWKMLLDLNTELGQRQAYYIKHHSGRRFTHTVLPSGLTELIFPSGQECFEQHKTRLEREERYIVRGGDHRGNPLGTAPRIHTRPEHWIEDFQENAEAVNRTIQKG